MTAAVVEQHAPSLPRAPRARRGVPLLGMLSEMRGDPLSAFVELYREMGPIFEVQAAHRRFTILAGPDANVFLQKRGEEFLGSRTLFGPMAEQLGAKTLLVAEDGEQHRHLRKQQQRGFSRGAGKPFVPHFIEAVDEATADWKPGDVVPVLPFMQRTVVNQLSAMMTGRRPGEMFEPIWTFLQTLMNACVIKAWPRIMLHRPAYKRARARCLEFAEEILVAHEQRGPGEAPDLIDDTLAMTTVDGQLVTRGDMRAAAIGVYFAGMDTVAATLSFMMYGALHDASVKERVRADADGVMQLGDELFDELKSFEDLHACALETLRMWPVAPFTPRVVEKPFAFAGHRLDKNEEVMVAQCVTHKLAEFFPDPERFDLDRHLAPRLEYRQRAMFAPFTLGAHTCLGAGLAEIQMLTTLAALMNRFDLELARPGEPVPMVSTPIPNPGRAFAVRIKARR
jgi:cytochrome P450